MDEIKNILRKHGMVIGSKVWGGFTNKADIDFALSNKYESQIYDLLIGNIAFETNNYPTNTMRNTKSLLIKQERRDINIIFYSEIDVETAFGVFEKINLLSSDGKLENREVRYLVCEAMLHREL